MFLRKYLVHFFLSVSLLVNAFLVVQWQLYREASAKLRLGMDIAAAKSTISQGMTLDEVLNRVHHDPYAITRLNDTTVYSWSTAQNGALIRLFGLEPEHGHYWLDVTFDNQGKIIAVVVSEA